jgi:hypothetical protein
MARILAVALQPSNGVVPPRALLLPLALAPVDGITAIYNFGDSISDTGNHIGVLPLGGLRGSTRVSTSRVYLRGLN